MTDINIYTIHPRIQSIEKDLLYLAKLCVGRICFREKYFQDNCFQMRSWLLKKSTLKNSLIIKWRKFVFFPANLQNKKQEKGVPFLVTYAILNSLSKIIRDNIYLLNMNEELSKTFWAVFGLGLVMSIAKKSSFLKIR